MTARFDTATSEARTALADADQDRLADLIAAFTASHVGAPVLTESRHVGLTRRHAARFDPAPDAEVEAFFARHRG